MNNLFRIHLASGALATDFSPKLTMCALKPFLTGFVQRGILALKTPEMKASIQKSFVSDGLFTTMRSDDSQLAMQMEVTLTVDDSLDISEEVEKDENVEELVYAIDSDDGDMSD